MSSGKPIDEPVDNAPAGNNDSDGSIGQDEKTTTDCTPGTPGCTPGGGRRRGSRKSNPWLAHVKETMKKNRGVSFKNVLKLAKKSFKNSKYGSKSKSQSKSRSQSKSKYGGKGRQRGGSGMAGKAPFGENAAPVV
jgi:hypothetical protein